MFRVTFLFVISVAVILPIPASAALRVFACEPEWSAVVAELAGERVIIDTATRPGQDPHFVQARPSLIAKIRRADLLVCTGAGLEAGWLPVLLRKGSNRKILPGEPGHLMIANGIELKDKPGRLDRSEGDIHANGNPHLQTDPRNIRAAAEAVVERLVQLDAANAEFYRRNLEVFEKRWQAATEQWERKAASLKNMPVVAYHRSWIYLQDWLQLKEVAVLEPKPGVPPGSGYLADVLDSTRDLSGLVIIHSQYQNSKAIKWFSGKSGAPVAMLPSTVGATPAAVDLYQWYDDIITRLLKAQESARDGY